jgi:hypothetical protein
MHLLSILHRKRTARMISNRPLYTLYNIILYNNLQIKQLKNKEPFILENNLGPFQEKNANWGRAGGDRLIHGQRIQAPC